MFDVEHDSPVPIPEQISSQVRDHVASGAFKPGARLAEYRDLAQELLTNPQAVARAYDELESEGVLRRLASGEMEVAPGAALICRQRRQDAASQALSDAVAAALAAGLADAEVRQAVEQALTAARRAPVDPGELPKAITKPTSHGNRHRAATGIQDLSRQGRAGPAEPDGAGGGGLRPAGG